jgi:2-dehydropantoate 2-reductase
MRMLVVGAGSTGGYFGGRLAAAGRDVTFLVRPGRAAQLAQDGLRILSPAGDLALPPRLVTADRIDGPYDAVLLTVKAYALDAALRDVAPAVGPDTMILPVLNGMRQVELISARFGAQALTGCVCKVAAELDDQGRIIHLAPFHDLAYGEMSGEASARTQALDGFMRDAGFNARLSPTIRREMWEKWILLASLGSITSLMRGNVGEVQAAPGGEAFANALLDEVVAIVQAVGTPPADAFLEFARAQLTARNSKQTSSMYRDLIKGAPVEAEQIVGDLLARGQQAGIAAPLLSAAFTHLSVYQNRLARA